MRMFKGWLWAVAVLAAGLLALSTGTRSVSAHAYVLHTDPADGAILAAPPKQLQVWFSETVLLDLSTFQLDDSHGHTIPIAPAHVDGADDSPLTIGGRSAGPMAAAVFLDVPTLAPGAYRLSWRAISAVDLHATTGDLVFGVQTSALPAHHDAASAAPPWGEVVFRWLAFGGIAGIVGALIVALFLVPSYPFDGDSYAAIASSPDTGDSTRTRSTLVTNLRRRLYALATWSGVAALLASVGLLVVQAGTAGAAFSGLGSSTWLVLTKTSYGLRWGVSVALIVVLLLISQRLWMASATARLLASGGVRAVLLSSVLALLVLHTLQSHAAAAVDSSALDVIVATGHVLAASLWAGGLLALALGCIPLLRHGTEGMSVAWGTLRRFGALALPSVVLLAITGLYEAGQEIATPDAVLLSPYGRTLLVKTALMLAVGALGLANAAVLHPAVAAALGRLFRLPHGWKPFSVQYIGRTLALEAAGAAIVVLLAAILASSQPARGPAYDPPVVDVSAASQNLSSSASDLVVVLDVKPDRPGQNFLTVGVYNTRRPAPAPITSVDVRLLPPGGGTPIEQHAASLGGSQYQVAGGMITSAGDWGLAVVVHRANLPDAATTIAWTVFPTLPPNAEQAPVVSRQPLAPFVDTTAVALLLLALAVVGTTWWVKTHPRRGPAAVSQAPEQRFLSLVRKD